MDLSYIEIVGWVAFIFILIGYYLNAKKIKTCFFFWAIGNVLYFLYGYNIDAFPIISTSVLILGMNLYGYINWNQK